METVGVVVNELSPFIHSQPAGKASEKAAIELIKWTLQLNQKPKYAASAALLSPSTIFQNSTERPVDVRRIVKNAIVTDIKDT